MTVPTTVGAAVRPGWHRWSWSWPRDGLATIVHGRPVRHRVPRRPRPGPMPRRPPLPSDVSGGLHEMSRWGGFRPGGPEAGRMVRPPSSSPATSEPPRPWLRGRGDSGRARVPVSWVGSVSGPGIVCGPFPSLLCGSPFTVVPAVGVTEGTASLVRRRRPLSPSPYRPLGGRRSSGRTRRRRQGCTPVRGSWSGTGGGQNVEVTISGSRTPGARYLGSRRGKHPTDGAVEFSGAEEPQGSRVPDEDVGVRRRARRLASGDESVLW
jgi:hypothetical protein